MNLGVFFSLMISLMISWWLEKRLGLEKDCSKKIFLAEAVAQRCSVKKGLLKFFLQNSQESTCTSLSFKKVADLYIFTTKRVVAEVFSCEFCDIFNDTFFIEYLWCLPGSASGNVFSSAVFLLALWISWLFLIGVFLNYVFDVEDIQISKEI